MDKKNKVKDNKDPKVSKAWLASVLEHDVAKPPDWTEKDVEQIGPAKPKSRLQGYLQEVYEALLEVNSARGVTLHTRPDGTPQVINLPTEDYFDKWYENNDIETYASKHKLMAALNSIASSVGQSGESGDDEDAFQRILAKLVTAVKDDPIDGILGIADAINRKYPDLAIDLNVPSTDEINEQEQNRYAAELAKIGQRVESNIDEYKDLIAEMASAAKTDFEELASTLNHVVIFGEALWELVLYSVVSPRAPRLLINSLDYRANLHTLLEGDISTAKSQIIKICTLISPKMLIVDETTKASLEGVTKREAIADGVLDLASSGNIIVEEFTKTWAKMGLFRRALDCKFMQFFKGGHAKGIFVNTTVIAACNPKDDFFQEDSKLRTQLPFKEGILSRFDVQIPLTATTSSNKMLVDRMNLFGEADVFIDFEDIKRKLELICKGMDTIQRIRINRGQLEMLREAFKDRNSTDHNRRILQNRPLVLLRDLETLARLVNVITAVNFTNRKSEDGILYADDEDVEKAIRLWENLIQLRIQLYANQSRIILSVADEIVKAIALSQRQNGVPIEEVYTDIVKNKQLIGRTTFYEEIKKLRNSGRIVQLGQRDSRLKVIID